jgi:hypothetical protein
MRARVNRDRIAKLLQQITPGNACAIAIKHRLYEQNAVTPTWPSRPGSKVLDAVPWSSPRPCIRQVPTLIV